MDISEVAKRTGVPASTLRHYEAKRLIVSIGRSGLRRVFAADVLERLAGHPARSLPELLPWNWRPQPSALDRKAA